MKTSLGTRPLRGSARAIRIFWRNTSKFGRLIYDAYLAFEEANDGGYSRFQHSLEHGKQRKPSEITGAPYFGLWSVPYQVLHSDHIRKQFVFGESDMSILESEANQAVSELKQNAIIKIKMLSFKETKI
jgi:hypothetical protein